MSMTDAWAALQPLIDTLQTALAGDFADHYSRYGGAVVLGRDEEPKDADSVGKPFIAMAVQVDEYDDIWQCRHVWVRVRTVANDFTGGRLGAMNLVASQSQLSTDLIACIEANYEALRDDGLFDLCVSGPHQLPVSNQGDNLMVNEHIIEFWYVRPPDV